MLLPHCHTSIGSLSFSISLYACVRVCVCVRYWFYLFDEREDRPYSAAAFCTVVVMVNEGGDSVKNL